MASPDDSGSRKLSVRIRTETLEAHQEAEQAPFVQDLLEGRLPVADYARLVAQHHAIYEVLEGAVAGSTDPVLAPFLAPELNRLPSIVADLEYLVGADWPAQYQVLPATDGYCDHLRAVCSEWPGGLLANHYLRYLGDLSGGQVIGRALKRIYGFPDHRGTEFYRFPGIASPKAFKDQYRRLLDALPWTEDRRWRLIDEVSVAYRFNTQIFIELAAPPVLADPAGPSVP